MERWNRIAETLHLGQELKNSRDLLYAAQSAYNAAIDSAPHAVCISDGDMDSKNVLWAEDSPRIIDLEALDYGNPYIEMFQLALSWAGGMVCDIDDRKLGAFLTAYREEYGAVQIDMASLSGAGFCWLDWLAYNTRRALGIECGGEEERRLGVGEVHETMRRIIYYDSVRTKLLQSAFVNHKKL